MKFTEIGVNLFDKQFRGYEDEVIKISKEHDVENIILTGSNLQNSIKAANYVKGKTGLYSTAGIHPHGASAFSSDTLTQLRKMISEDPKIIAVGECGLDYDRMFSPKDAQKNAFIEQIKLAEELNKPLFLHERKAVGDFTNIMKKYPKACNNSVVHCFTGDRTALKTYLSLGCYIGITGWVCDERRGKQLQSIIKLIPKDKLLIETDSPYLMPRNSDTLYKVNNSNTPANICFVASKIAQLMNCTIEEIVQITTENAVKLFSLK